MQFVSGSGLIHSPGPCQEVVTPTKKGDHMASVRIHSVPASPPAPLVKDPPAMQEGPGSIPGSESSPGEGIGYPLQYSWASLVAQLVKNLPAMWETWVGKISWRRA